MPHKSTHRKRFSADTTHSLPVYNLDDKPPDYPDSAEEADEDTDSSEPSSFSLTSPRRRRHRRRQSTSTDPYLDSLLARSVHALEMSNTLLQSSMSTQTALSTIFADTPTDEALETRARGLSMRIEQRETHSKWVDDLAEISRGVDGLFAETEEIPPVSCSLPTSSSASASAIKRHKRRPSMLELRSPESPPKSDIATPAYTMLSSLVHQRSPSSTHRPMTPPNEESSSSSSDGCLAKRTVLSLRKILDEQPPLPPSNPKRLRAPAFLPRTPAPAAEAGTSTATASISRLYTRGKHTSSTRPPSPPRQSAMKHRPQSQSPPPAPAPQPATSTIRYTGIPDLLVNNMRNWSTPSLRSLGGTSAPSSGRSTPTPRKISFAELPEAYRGSTSARFRERERRRRERRGKGGANGKRDGETEGGWWTTWFLGGTSSSSSTVREERIEERLGRGWAGRMPGAPVGLGPAMDEWAI